MTDRRTPRSPGKNPVKVCARLYYDHLGPINIALVTVEILLSPCLPRKLAAEKRFSSLVVHHEVMNTSLVKHNSLLSPQV